MGWGEYGASNGRMGTHLEVVGEDVAGAVAVEVGKGRRQGWVGQLPDEDALLQVAALLLAA